MEYDRIDWQDIRPIKRYRDRADLRAQTVDQIIAFCRRQDWLEIRKSDFRPLRFKHVMWLHGRLQRQDVPMRFRLMLAVYGYFLGPKGEAENLMLVTAQAALDFQEQLVCLPGHVVWEFITRNGRGPSVLIPAQTPVDATRVFVQKIFPRFDRLIDPNRILAYAKVVRRRYHEDEPPHYRTEGDHAAADHRLQLGQSQGPGNPQPERHARKRDGLPDRYGRSGRKQSGQTVLPLGASRPSTG